MKLDGLIKQFQIQGSIDMVTLLEYKGNEKYIEACKNQIRSQHGEFKGVININGFDTQTVQMMVRFLVDTVGYIEFENWKNEYFYAFNHHRDLLLSGDNSVFPDGDNSIIKPRARKFLNRFRYYCRCRELGTSCYYDIDFAELDRFAESHKSRAEKIAAVMSKAWNNRILNVAEIVICSDSELYYNHFRKKNIRIDSVWFIDLRNIGNDILAGRLINFMCNSFDPEKMSLEFWLKCYAASCNELVNYIRDTKDSESSSVTELELPDNAKVKQFYGMFQKYCNYDIHSAYESNVWKISDFNIEQFRNAQEVKTLKFRGLSRKNAALVKKYVSYYINATDYSISTIAGWLTLVRDMLYLCKKDIDQWDSDDVHNVLKLASRECSSNLYNRRFAALSRLINYLIDFEDIDTLTSVAKALDKAKPDGSRNSFKFTAPDDFVLQQIFMALDKMDVEVRLWYLMVFAVGMRSIEAVCMTCDCLREINGHYFLNYYNHKLRKDVQNEIPESLYQLICDYVSVLPVGRKYLFIQPLIFKRCHKEKHQRPSYFKKKLNDFFKKQNICYRDGRLYKYAPHSYRHLTAVTMRRMGIPYWLISEWLHHENFDMTTYYKEFTEYEIVDSMSRSDNVQETPIPYMSGGIVVFGGRCCRPAVLGACDDMSKCLKCSSFVPSNKYINYYKKALADMNRFIDEYPDDNRIDKVRSDAIALNDVIKRLEFNNDC